MVAEGTDDRSRLARGFGLAVGRAADAAEVDTLLDGLAADRATFAADPAAAERFVTAGSAGRTLGEVTGGMPASEFAPWCLAANVILNLDEFVMRE